MATQKQKTQKNTVSSSNAVTPSVVGSVAAPPTAPVPTAPVGFDPTTMTVPRGGGRAPSVIASSGANVATELTASPTFAEDFGTKIPAVGIASALTNAGGWRQVRNASTTWLDYVKYGDAQAFEVVQRELERFRKVYVAAVAIDASVPARYPNLDALFKAMSAPAKRSASTRKQKKAQAETASAAHATASAAPATPAAPPAPAKASA